MRLNQDVRGDAKSAPLAYARVYLEPIFFPLEVYFLAGELRGPCGPEKKSAKFEVCGMNFDRNLRNLRLFNFARVNCADLAGLRIVRETLSPLNEFR